MEPKLKNPHVKSPPRVPLSGILAPVFFPMYRNLFTDRMHNSFLIILSVLILPVVVSAICPAKCECDFDRLGRKRVSCINGGMIIPEDIRMLDLDTKVLIITGFEGCRPNMVTLTPKTPLAFPRNIEELHLTFTDLETMGDKPFFYMSDSLRFLNLSYNALSAVSDSNFNNLSHVTELHLNHNQLITMPPITTFRFLTSLKLLNLSSNHIDDISHAMFDPRDRLRYRLEIEILDISCNPIGEPDTVDHAPALPDYFFNEFPSLVALNVSNCSLTELPWPDIQKYSPLLLDLDLSYNQFTTIRAGQLDVTSLRNISLKGNPISVFEPGSMKGMYLEVLDLSELSPSLMKLELFEGVRIERLYLADMGLTGDLRDFLMPLADDLVGLDISGNPDLPLVGRMFEFVPYLAEVNMARMNLEFIKANIFRYENEIEFLDLSENRFEYITPAFFQPLIQLEVLDLSNNIFLVLPLTLAMPSLATLDLAENKLIDFSPDLVAALSASTSVIETLYLNGNPWRCDCGIADLMAWVRVAGKKRGMELLDNCTRFGFTDSYRQPSDTVDCAACYTPRRVRGALLSLLPANHFSDCAAAEPENDYPDDTELFQCYTCNDPLDCWDTWRMNVINCDNSNGDVTSCLRIEDVYGIERGCGNPDEIFTEESCEEGMGPYYNYTTCTCTTTLCNQAEGHQHPNPVMVVIFTLFATLAILSNYFSL